MRKILIAILGWLILFNSNSASAQDANTDFLLRIFRVICIPNMGNPDGVRALTAQQKLPPITDRFLLDTFVGSGATGDAWIVPGPTPQKFAISIRKETEACSVWGEQAEPKYLEEAFSNILKGAVRPGIELKLDGIDTNQTQYGLGKAISYHLYDPTSGNGFEFVLFSSEHPGGLIQGRIQVSRVAAH